MEVRRQGGSTLGNSWGLVIKKSSSLHVCLLTNPYWLCVCFASFSHVLSDFCVAIGMHGEGFQPFEWYLWSDCAHKHRWADCLGHPVSFLPMSLCMMGGSWQQKWPQKWMQALGGDVMPLPIFLFSMAWSLEEFFFLLQMVCKRLFCLSALSFVWWTEIFGLAASARCLWLPSVTKGSGHPKPSQICMRTAVEALLSAVICYGQCFSCRSFFSLKGMWMLFPVQ